jgi:hypothetical protein
MKLLLSNPRLSIELNELVGSLMKKNMINVMHPPSTKIEQMKTMMKMMQDKEIRDKLMDIGPLMMEAMKKSGIRKEDLMDESDGSGAQNLVNMLLSAPKEQK